ncbi:MAG TPA: ice-binding family protein [Acidimicrobiales bacterium]|nr:ice-binding family protein [Acidimicrobiales bacterium]
MSTRSTTNISWTRRLDGFVVLGSALMLAGVTSLFAFTAGPAFAAPATVNLNSATSYAILAGTTITNTGSSVIAGDIGLSPGTALTGFPPGSQSSGTPHITDANAATAQTDLTAAYVDASTRTPATAIPADLGGQTLTAGIYAAPSSLGVTGTLTLNGAGDSTSVFIIQAPSALTTASASSVVLENGAQACNVFWQVTSSATLGTNSTFVGTIIALSSITLTTGANVQGRVLARNGAVTLDGNQITVPTCAAPVTTTTTIAPTTTTTTTTIAPTTTTTAPPSTTTTVPIIPIGAPGTGFGGTAGGGSSPLAPWGLGALSVILGAGAAGYGLRRHRLTSSPSRGNGETRHR